MSGEDRWHLMPAEDVLSKLRTSETGLSSEEVKIRQRVHGKNEIRESSRISILKIFVSQFNVLIVILLAATAVSVVFGNVIDALVIFSAVILCVTLGFFFEFKSEKAMKALKDMAAPMATVVRDGVETKIPSIEIVPGDILVLRAGTRIAADARLLEAVNLEVDESALTGESASVRKDTSVLDEDVIIADRRNMVFAGTTVTYGRGKGVVTATGMHTELGKIAQILTEAITEETPLKRRLNEIGRWLGVIYLCICAALFVLGVLSGVSVLGMLLWSISLAVAVVPETLPLIITGTLALGVQRMARRNAIVRQLPAVETLGCVTTICSDKTGTLTRNEMTVRSVYVDGKMIQDYGTATTPDRGDVAGLKLALQIAVLCNDAHVTRATDGYRVSGEPTEVALVQAAEKAGINKAELEKRYPRVDEIPFERERKRMSTIHRIEGGKTVAYVKGAPEVLLGLSTGIYRDRKVVQMTDREREAVLGINNELAAKAMRVIAVAYRELPSESEREIERDLVFVGLFGMSDPPREEAKPAIEECKRAGIKTVMITGDHKLTAVAIARELGMVSNDDPEVLTGTELESMSEEELESCVNRIRVYSRVSPVHKLRIVKALKRKGHVVAMTGDGINDAPALRMSDVGVAMNSGTDVAKEASDMILVDDNFATIVAAIREGRVIYENMKKYLLYVLSYAFAEVSMLSGAFLLGILTLGSPLFPLIAVQILWTNLVIEDLPAMGLGIEPPERDIMSRKPRDPNERVFTKGLIVLLILMSAVISVGCMAIFLNYLPEVAKARTMVFATLILYEMVNAFNCRSERHSLFRVGILTNRWLILGVMASLVLMVVAVQFGSQFFHTVPLTVVDWCIAGATGVTVCVAVELWKLVREYL